MHQYETGLYDDCVESIPSVLWTLLISSRVMNVLTDIFILSLPVRCVWGLQMKTTLKVQVIGLFLLGGVCVLVAALLKRPVLMVTGSASLALFDQSRSGSFPMMIRHVSESQT